MKRLVWEDLCYEVKDKIILRHITGYLETGEIVAVLGPSGSGKTSLLNAVCGRISSKKLTGTVLVDSHGREPTTWRKSCALLQQDELFLSHLTVREAILFSALLRLDSRLPVKLKIQRVDTVIVRLGLLRCQHTIISKISGGERKRTALASELVTAPTFIILDEPTSGLDSFTALSLIECLSGLTCESKGILISIHQPRSSILEHFTRVILMTQGAMVFMGTVHDACTYFSGGDLKNIADSIMDLITVDIRTPELQTASQELVNFYINLWRTRSLGLEEMRLLHTQELETRSVSGELPVGAQIGLLISRYLTDYRRYRNAVLALLLQTFAVAFFVSTVFWQQGSSQASIQNRSGLLFFLVAQIMFSFTMPVCISVCMYDDTYRLLTKEKKR